MSEHLFSHKTSKAGIEAILGTGHIKSVARVAKDHPDTELNVQPYPGRIKREKMRAEDAYEKMRKLKSDEVDKVFFVRGGYVSSPSYGDYVIVKHLRKADRRYAFNTVPKEHTRRR